jgi:nucleoside-diphosphate-sugar epimerase
MQHRNLASSNGQLHNDLNEILKMSEGDLKALDGTRLLITGGTGFIGTWLLETLVWAKNRLGVGPSIEVVTRSPDSFRKRSPHLVGALKLHLTAGDVLKPLKIATKPDMIFHAATSVNENIKLNEPLRLFDTIVIGTQNVLEFSATCNKPRLLFTSSGAVYGALPTTVQNVKEDFMGGPDPLSVKNVYAEGKRAAEMLGAIANATGTAEVVNARIFAQIGPLLPLDAHFAAGNFVRDALKGGPIVVQGDGRTVRSYQYIADTVSWLLGTLLRGEPGTAYNVGSDEAINIADLAHLIGESSEQQVTVMINGKIDLESPVDWYVPSVERATKELSLVNTVSLKNGILRTLEWNKNRN